MKYLKTSICLLATQILFLACTRQQPASDAITQADIISAEPEEAKLPETLQHEGSFEIPKPVSKWIDPNGTTLETRFKVPTGFARVDASAGSFGGYLRKLPLKPDGALVLYYDGTQKNYLVYEAVVDLPIGKRDLHQCADAIMRLKAEYHFKKGEYDKIHFNFTNGYRVDYTEWIKGRRMIIEGNKTYWSAPKAASSTSYESFWKYMELIFSYAGTASLSKELQAVAISDLKIGDIFIKGGFPGHGVIVVDMATDNNGKKLFMLAQSYMPAQETQVLKNPANDDISPWYEIPENGELFTPEYFFETSHLMRFKD